MLQVVQNNPDDHYVQDNGYNQHSLAEIKYSYQQNQHKDCIRVFKCSRTLPVFQRARMRRMRLFHPWLLYVPHSVVINMYRHGEQIKYEPYWTDMLR